MQEITWLPVLLSMSAIAGFAMIEHLRLRERKRNARSGFRRMQSPYARPRHRSQVPAARAAFTQPYHADSRKGFSR